MHPRLFALSPRGNSSNNTTSHSSSNNSNNNPGDGPTLRGSQVFHLPLKGHKIVDMGAHQRGSHTLRLRLRRRPRTRTADPRRSTAGIHPLRLRLDSRILLPHLLASLCIRTSCMNSAKVPTDSDSNTHRHNKCSRMKTSLFRPVAAFRSRSQLPVLVLHLHLFLPWPCPGGQTILETRPKSLLAPYRRYRSTAPTRSRSSRRTYPRGHSRNQNRHEYSCRRSRGRAIVRPRGRRSRSCSSSAGSSWRSASWRNASWRNANARNGSGARTRPSRRRTSSSCRRSRACRRTGARATCSSAPGPGRRTARSSDMVS